MKILDKVGLVIFSIIIMVLAILFLVVSAGWLSLDIVIDGLKYLVANDVPTKVTIVVSTLLGLFAIRCIFFNSFTNDAEKSKENILLENENGKLLVSKDTIENITNTVIKNFDGAESVMTKVALEDVKNISIYITLFVKPETIIKDLAAKLQADVKLAVKNSIDLEIKSVNIRIKNIVTKKENTIKQLQDEK